MSVTSLCSDSLQNHLSQTLEFEPAAELLTVQQRRVHDVRVDHLHKHTQLHFIPNTLQFSSVSVCVEESDVREGRAGLRPESVRPAQRPAAAAAGVYSERPPDAWRRASGSSE